MIPDLERLIRLQELENIIEDTRRTIEGVPSRREALDTRIAACNEAVVTARQRVEDGKVARLAIEKDLAVVQGHLSKFRTSSWRSRRTRNIRLCRRRSPRPSTGVQSLEDQVLEQMLQADELALEVTRVMNELTTEQAAGLKSERP